MLSSWFYRARPDLQPVDRPVVLFCHGNNGHIGERDYMISLAQLVGFDLAIFDYAGYGKSTGVPSLPQLENDALVMYDRVAAEFPEQRIIVWGESLGSQAAVAVAYARPCDHLLILAGFSSFDDIIRHSQDGIAGRLLGLTIRNMLDVSSNVEKIPHVTCPVTIVHSVEDSFIPYICAEKLYHAAHGNKKIFAIRGDHATPDLTPKVLCTVFDRVGMPCPDRLSLSHWIVKQRAQGERWMEEARKLLIHPWKNLFS